MLRMYSDNLVSLPQLDSIIQELEFRINQLNENNKRARTLSVRLSNSITDGHRYICVENGTGSSVASIQVWKVANERY